MPSTIALSLSAKEQASMATCGCRLARVGSSVTFERCALHEAAPALLEAVKEIRRHIRNDGAGVERQLDRIDDVAHAALRAAKG